MKIKFSNKGNNLVAGIIGEIDHHNAEYLRNKIDAEIVKVSTKNVIFDFSKVSFMDSSGIGVIIGRYKNIQKLGGKVAIVNLTSQVQKILEMSGLFKIVPFYDNIDVAISKINN